MSLKEKKILIVNNENISLNLETTNTKFGIEYFIKEINGLSNFNESLVTEIDYILFLDSVRLRNKETNLELVVRNCIQFLEVNEHYAICQPTILYGEVSELNYIFDSNIKSHTNLNNVDDAFLVIKGKVVQNFSLKEFIVGDKVNWRKYIEEINYYGFQCCRLLSDFIEVAYNENIEFIKDKPRDCFDIINLGFIKKNADIGFELSYLDPIYNGTSEYALNILPTMIETFSGKKISFKIIASNNIIAKFALEKYGDYLISPEESQNYFFHLLFIPQQIYSDIALEKINRSCFKFVFTLLDVIALRCNYISRGYSLDIPCSLAYKYSEQIIGLTESSAKDIENFFKERMIDRAVTPILLTKEEVIDDKSLDTKEEKISFIGKNYILLIGNAFKHKAIEKALEFLNKSEYNVVVIGYLPEKKKYNDRIKFFESGNESNELINNLYLNSKLIFYPSLYEGFGLPVVAAIQMRKKILVFDSDVNRELKKTFDRNDCVYFFNNFSKISNRIQEVLESPQILNSNRNFSEFRSWKNVSAETSELLLKVFASPINLNKINARIYEVITLKIVERGIQITAMDKTISTLLNSSTLKIGLFITWPIRKIKSFFK
jgi:hypothetical protein